MVSEKFIYSPQKRKGILISCVKTTEAAKTENSSGKFVYRRAVKKFVYLAFSKQVHLTNQ